MSPVTTLCGGGTCNNDGATLRWWLTWMEEVTCKMDEIREEEILRV